MLPPTTCMQGLSVLLLLTAAGGAVVWCAVWRDWSDELRSIGVDDSSPALARRLWWNDPREEVLSPRAPPTSPKL